MRRFLASTAVMLVLGLPGALHAQVLLTEPEYSEGALPSDPGYEQGLPLVQRHRAFLPVSVDLSSRLPEPGSQGKLGSCTAWAVAYAARSYYTLALEKRDIHRNANLPSPNYIFHLARTAPCESGSTVQRVVEVMQKGALSLRDYPYSELCVPPATQAYIDRATDFRVRGVKRVDFNNIDDIKGQLALSNPVIFQFRDTKGFMGFHGAGVFSEQIPPDVTPTLHEMVFIGYDDRRQALRILNSWGREWGDHGYAWLSYDLVKSRIGHAYTLDVAPPQDLVAHNDAPPVTPVQPPVTTVQQPPRPQTPPATPVQQPPKPQTPPQVVVKPPAPVPTPTPQTPPTPVVAVPTRKADLSDLPNLSCARVAVQQGNGRNTLLGFVGYQADLDLVHQIARNVPNTSADGVLLAPWPQCEALLTLEKPLVATDSPTLNIDSANMHAGDTLKITVHSPAQISYLYVAYVQADGSVVQLAQPQGVVPAPTLPNQTLVFGDGLENRPKFTIGAPFGPEMIIALASRSPLFDAALPQQETEREFLSALRRALIYKPSPDLPDREVTAAIKMLNTSAR